MHKSLPLPRLERRTSNSVTILTDDTLAQTAGVRLLFAERTGGVSPAPYDSLNFGLADDDVPENIARNCELLKEALGMPGVDDISLNQVHGTEVLVLSEGSAAEVADVKARADAGADAIVVECAHELALLRFADCVPVIAVAPSGRFAVIHAGWRGVEASIAPKAIGILAQREVAAGEADDVAQAAAACNIYIGACIHGECFEVGPDVHAKFTDKFGETCAYDAEHIDLVAALRTDMARAGVSESRIADVGICTACTTERFFSFRAEDGITGRHAVGAVRVR